MGIKFIRCPRLNTTSRFGKLMGVYTEKENPDDWFGWKWPRTQWDGLFFMLGDHAYILAWRGLTTQGGIPK